MTKLNSWITGVTLIGSFLLIEPCFSQNVEKDVSVLYVVRHAEKDTGNNPVLSSKGRERAGDLHRALQNRPVDLILVSQYRRTGMTGDSVRLYRNIETRSYKADATGDDLFKLINSYNGQFKHILIIGHSNTVPVIVRRAGAKDYLPLELPDSSYDHLFTVRAQQGKITWQLEKYGALSTTASGASTMQILQ